MRNIIANVCLLVKEKEKCGVRSASGRSRSGSQIRCHTRVTRKVDADVHIGVFDRFRRKRSTNAIRNPYSTSTR